MTKFLEKVFYCLGINFSGYNIDLEVEYLKKHVPNSYRKRNVIDIGGGDGEVSLKLMPVLKPTSFLLVDMYDAFVKAAKKRGLKAKKVDVEKQVLKDALWEYLPRSHRRRKRKKVANSNWLEEAKIQDKTAIEKRHTKANNRKQIGHWETDLMESKRGVDTVVSVHIERKTRFTKLEKLNNKKAQTKQKGMQKTLKRVQSVSKSRGPIVKTVTYDNGSENTQHQKLNKNLGIKSYFCHPYHSWEKGSVENVIGRVRRFLPKGTDLSTVSDTYVQQVENWINDAPLKCLNWKTPNEAMEQETNTYKFRNYRKVLNLCGAFPD